MPVKLPQKILQAIRSYPLFHQKVWRACAEIPKGEVRSYRWVAGKIGRPGAARAVGQALKRNPFSPRVPCHRVVRSDGSLGGYTSRYGLEHKRELLKKEGALELNGNLTFS